MILNEPILTPRLTLRTLVAADANDNYLAWMQDQRVTRFLESRLYTPTTESLEQFITDCNSDPNVLLLGITLRDSGRHIGNIKLGPIDCYHRRGDIGLMIGDMDAWGQGFAREAIAGVSDFATNVLALHKITASCYECNQGSLRAFLGAGWSVEGMRPSHSLCEGKWENCVQLSLILGTGQDL